MPPILRLPLLSTLVCSVTAPVWAVEVITGVSLVPTIVIVTGCVELTPVVGDRHVVDHSERLPGGEEIESSVGGAERESN